MKSLWNGYIALGQLGIPVRLYNATRSIAPELHLVHQTDGSPVERVLKCKHEDREISHSETIRAAEVGPGSYVTLTKQELERAAPHSAKVIHITQFAHADAIEPIHYDKPYYMVPAKGGERAYALLRDVLMETGTLAVAQFVMRGNEHVAAVTNHRDMLVLHQLRYADEIVPRGQLKTRSLPKPSPTERAALRQVVERFSSSFFIEDYHDEQAETIHELIERKSQGLPPPRRERESAQATSEEDIIPALQHTLREPAGIKA